MTHAFTLRSSQPTDPERATYAAAARATLEAERFNALDAEDDPAFGYIELPTDHDLSIVPGCRMHLLGTPDTFVNVLRVYSDDTLDVELVGAKGVRWRVGVGEIGYGLTPECAAMGEVG